MAAMAFTEVGWDPTFAVGAAVAGLGTNARAGRGEWFVAEADESDGTLVAYPSTLAIVTTVEADHLDHYGTEEAVHEATGALGGVLGWVTNTIGSAILGLIVGAIVVAVMHVIPRKGGHGEHEAVAKDPAAGAEVRTDEKH